MKNKEKYFSVYINMIIDGYAKQCVFDSKNWFNIGKLIYLISEGSNKGYRLWLLYSQFDRENYIEQRCYELWSDFDD